MFDLKQRDFDRDEFEKHVIGPTGNLRAPALRLGQTWLIGFGDEAYADMFG
ncbi:MAG: hypothetical protein JNL28_03755 [Planctomycetes bacterium]|nr:hypothetical protein [Planctomycetota bacterium]